MCFRAWIMFSFMTIGSSYLTSKSASLGLIVRKVESHQNVRAQFVDVLHDWLITQWITVATPKQEGKFIKELSISASWNFIMSANGQQKSTR